MAWWEYEWWRWGIDVCKCTLVKEDPLPSLLHWKVDAPPGNRTRVTRMGILYDTTTPAAQMYFPLPPWWHNRPFSPFSWMFVKISCGDVGDWTRDLSHAKRTLYHWATSPSIVFKRLLWKKIRHWALNFNKNVKLLLKNSLGLCYNVTFQPAIQHIFKSQHLLLWTTHWYCFLLCIEMGYKALYYIWKSQKFGDVGDWTRDLSHAKRTLYHWATSPTINPR